MNRILASLSAASLLVASAAAQCATPSGGTQITTWGWTYTNDDGISSNHVPLGFNFPIAGAAATTFNNVRVGSNGWVMLTDGTNSAGLPGNSTYGSVTALGGGVAGDFPILAPFWGDLWWDGNTTDGVFVSNNPGISCKISWVNVRDYFAANTLNYSFAVELFVTGEVRMHYSTNAQNVTLQAFSNVVGVSCRNGVAAPTASDLFPNVATSIGGMIYETYPQNGFDGSGTSLVLTPAGLGWVTTNCTGTPASNSLYGTGCYDIPATGFYELLANATVASTALQGNAMLLTRNANGYTSVWLPGVASALYVAPTAGATVLALTDDGDVAVPLGTPLPTPAGPASQLNVSGNGIITIGALGNNAFDYTPTGTDFASATEAAFYSWHDFNVSEAGSGQVKSEQVGNTLYITYDDVENYASPSVANRSTLQCQFDLNSGNVTWVWLTIDSNATSTFGSSHLVGVRGLGPITDGGTQILSAAPLTNTHNFVLPLDLTASAPLVYGTSVTYTTSNIPEFAAGSGIYIGMHILSLGQNPGVDLGFIGAPGCSAYVTSLDLTTTLVGFTPSQTNTITVPASGPAGFQLFSQSVGLITPNSLPNGQNAFGLVTSNAIAHTLNSF